MISTKVGGTVEEVWVTSTKIKLFANGERIHMANSKILASGVVNHNERTTRRVNKYWHLSHDSDPAAVERFLERLDAIADRDDIRPHITKFGEAPHFGAHVMNLRLVRGLRARGDGVGASGGARDVRGLRRGPGAGAAARRRRPPHRQARRAGGAMYFVAVFAVLTLLFVWKSNLQPDFNFLL